MRRWGRYILLLCLVTVVFVWARPVSAETDPNKLREQIEELTKQVLLLQNQANTLSNQIKQFDAQIRLTQLRIDETEERIKLLGGRIDQLEGSLDSLTKAFSTRATETYKMSRVGEPFIFLLSSEDLNEGFIKLAYLKKIQESDRDLLVRLQVAQNTYKTQKTESEVLQEKLNIQKSELATQKAAKAQLLAVTRNDEKKYQQLLAQARAEYEAIQAIIAGKGQEEEVGDVSQGQRIAYVIQGVSCNSNGTHLHFTVAKDGLTTNPFNYLKQVDYNNNSGGDPFNPTGSWEWPISPRISFNQGYGTTWATRNDPVIKSTYTFHNGIDINGTSSEVRAVSAGKLFRGSYTGKLGCRLRYVRVHHIDGGLDTFYLHINY